MEFNPDLLAHLAWADAAHWRVLVTLPDGRKARNLRQRLHHMHEAQHYFANLILGEDCELPPAESFKTARDLAGYARQAHRRLELAWQAGQSRLAERFALPFLQPVREVDLGELLHQVVMHSAHHRGQNAMMMRALGLEPPTVDFLMWVWQGRPPADWTFLE